MTRVPMPRAAEAPDFGRRRLRILHLPVDLGGHPAALARAQRALGHDAVAANLAWSPFGFHGDVDYGVEPGRPSRLLRREFGRAVLFARSLRADVVHAHFGQTLCSIRPFPIADPSRRGIAERLTVEAARRLWLADVGLWRRLGKAVAMTFYGDDARLVEGAAARNPWTHLTLPDLAAAYAARDPWKRRLGSRLAAAGVILFAANPDLLETLPEGTDFLPYGAVDVVPQAPPIRPERTLRLLHLPSDRSVKGTDMVIATVERLRAEGVDCRLTVAEGLPHRDVLPAILRHDAFVDQLRVGWYGNAAVEAMAAGRPALAHIAPDGLARIPAGMAAELPVVAATPDTLAARIRELVAMEPAAIRELGARARAFVARWHAPEAVARRTLEAYATRLRPDGAM